MKTLQSPKSIQSTILGLKNKGKRIAFVPTMGFLHAGHLQLVELAKKYADVIVVSIFVNPLQFGPKEDLATYPRDHKTDLKKLMKHSVDFAFLPTVNDMYASSFQTKVNVQSLSQDLCGLNRPGHFEGVATVVLKLFHLIQPDVAIFGKKDYQQYLIIQQMVRDLSLPIKIVGAPLIRENDGLAMSSRNVRLGVSDRQAALRVSKALFAVKSNVKQGIKVSQIEKRILSDLQKEPAIQIEYIAVRHSETLMPLTQYLPRKTLVALAVWVGSVRLIDNLII